MDERHDAHDEKHAPAVTAIAPAKPEPKVDVKAAPRPAPKPAAKKPPAKKPPAKVARETHGIVLLSEPGVYVRWTPMGKGKWRVEANAYDQDEIVPGPDYAHNGKYLHLDGVLFDQVGHPLYDGQMLAPIEKDEG